VQSAGGTPLVIPTDVADAEQVERAAERVEAELGPIDVWVNGLRGRPAAQPVGAP
jgi:NAD(P)-dependent dehydrogenase (short-subunit alcohol dehydrogenase family)